ncbi:MAG: metal-dependent hydrolase [Bacteroidota bacterium]
MNITYYGQSCFGVEVSGIHLLFDPFISPNPHASHISLDQVKADYILISHGHQDHVADVASIAKQTGATLISNFEIINWFAKQGIKNGHPLNHGGSYSFDFGRVKYVNAVHTSSMPDGSYGGNPGGFVISSMEGDFYHSGDTALTYDMKLIGEQYQLAFAFLCLGDNFTMGIDDALIASGFIRCSRIIGMHFDTFPYIKINHEEAKDKFAAAGKDLTLMEIGETIAR